MPSSERRAHGAAERIHAATRASSHTGDEAVDGTSHEDFARLRAATIAAQQQDARDDERFHARASRGQLGASNPAQGFDVRYRAEGAQVALADRGGSLAITTRAIGCGDSLSAIEPSAPTVSSDDPRQVEYERSGAVQAREWFLNGVAGLEQGYVVESAACGDRPLVFEVELSGLDAREEQGRIALADSSGRDRLAYGDLFATDADGTMLPARLALAYGRARLEVDVSSARFPVSVDPLVVTQEAVLGPDSPGTGTASSYFGSSVSISVDTAVVNSPSDYYGGSAYIFVRSGSSWALQQRITNPNYSPGSNVYNGGFASSVAVSGDTLVVGYADFQDDGVDQYSGAGMVLVYVRSGSTWTLQQTLTRGSGQGQGAAQGYGNSVAIDGNTIVAGAPGETTGLPAAGAVYIFVRSGTVWSLNGRIMAPSPTGSARFGADVAIQGSRIVIGEPGRTVGSNGGQGVAYLWEFTTSWSQTATLTALDGAVSDQFGTSVDVDGTSILVGAPYANVGSLSDAGAGYVFVDGGATVTQQAKLVGGSGAAAVDMMGSDVALAGDVAVLGATGWAVGGVDTGAGIVFTRSGTTWSFAGARNGGNSRNLDLLGRSVAIDGTSAVIGAPNWDEAGRGEQGEAMVFAGSGLPFQAYLAAGRSASEDHFAQSIDVSGNTVVVGVPLDDSQNVLDGGCVYVFVRGAGGNYTLQAKLTAPAPVMMDYFGHSVSIDGDLLAVGVPRRDVGTGNGRTGAIMMYRRSGTNWSLESSLVTSAPQANAWLGRSVALHGNHLVAGEPDYDVGTTYNTGRIAFFEQTSPGNWTNVTTVIPTAAVPGDATGANVAVFGPLAVIGVPYAKVGTTFGQGVAYTYRWNGSGWTEQTPRLTLAGAQSFGTSVAINGTRMVIGVPAASSGRGLVQVYTDTGGAFGTPVTLSLAAAVSSTNFGTGVDFDGSVLSVSQLQRLHTFYFDGSSFVEQGTINPPPSFSSTASYGTKVASATGIVVVTAPDFSDGNTLNEGRAVAYSVSGMRGQGCTANAQCGSGFCVDGVCCDTACGGGGTNDCQACSVAAGATTNGVCATITASASYVCRAADGSGCDVAETCNGSSTLCPSDGKVANGTSCNGSPSGICDAQDTCQAGACQANYAPASTQCSAPSCSNGTGTPGANCTGSSALCPTVTPTACQPYACGTTACRTTCGTDSDCDAAYYCSGNSCVAKLSDGQTCLTANQCLSGMCGGVCGGAVDECALNADNCDPNATCTDQLVGFTCACNTGFTGNGTTCTDVNECLTNNGGCAATATCTNTPGSRMCACNSGYTGDGFTCTDVNECATNNGTCSTSPMVTCTNTAGSYSCAACPTGYSGDGHTCTDIDECATNNGGCSTSPMVTCTNTVGSRSCGTCPAGYTGNGTTCTDVDECALNTDNCSISATCTNTQGSFSCTCNGGYTGNGQTCTDINECVLNTDNCSAYATCTNTQGTFTCSCDAGFTGSGTTCTDVNECLTNNGGCSTSPMVACTNTLGSRTCAACPSGYSGDGTTCTDLNECTLGTDTCTASQACTNAVGSFSCTTCDTNASVSMVGGVEACVCNSGYGGDGQSCTANACSPSCGTNAVCGASFTCSCPAGYSGNPLVSCSDVDECTSNTDNCSANADCTNTVGWFSCACKTGYTGDGVTCADIDECTLNTDTCATNATCTNTGGSYLCTCDLGYQGNGFTCVPVGTDAGISTDAGMTGVDGGTDASAPSDSGTDATVPGDGSTDSGVPPNLRDRPSVGLCSTSVGSREGGGSVVGGTLFVLFLTLVRRRRRRANARLLAALFLGATLAGTASVSAQATDESVARAQFQLGQAYLNEGRFHEAGVAFEAAYAASHRAGLLYNAYVAYRDAQELENAANALRRFIAADPAGDTPLMRGRLEAIETQLASQRAAAEAAERARQQQAAADAAAAAATTSTEASATANTETNAATDAGATSAEAASQGPSRGLAYGLIGGGAGVAALGFLGGGLGASAQHDRLAPYCGTGAGLPVGQCLDVPTVSDVESKTRMFRAIAWGSLGLGVSAAAVGAVLLITGGDDEEGPAVTALPTCTSTGCSLTLLGRF